MSSAGRRGSQGGLPRVHGLFGEPADQVDADRVERAAVERVSVQEHGDGFVDVARTVRAACALEHRAVE